MNPNDDSLNVLVLVDFSDEIVAQLRALSPRLAITRKNVASVEQVSAETWANTNILYTTRLLPAPEAAPRLHWIQSHFAGIDALLSQPLLRARPDVILTTASGIHASPMAEYTFAMILASARKLPLMLRMQSEAAWPPDRHDRLLPTELRGTTLGIVGYGSIGRAIARIASAFGMTVLATKRDVKRPGAGDAYEEPGIGDTDASYVDRLYPPEALKSMVSQCDFVVIVLPLTPETRGSYNADVIAAMKRGSVLINIARGGIVDETALLEALRSGLLGGACLDVFAEEPLPATSPFWTQPNVIISPHVAGNTARYNERAAAVFTENLRRYLNKADLLNRVDLARGY